MTYVGVIIGTSYYIGFSTPIYGVGYMIRTGTGSWGPAGTILALICCVDAIYCSYSGVIIGGFIVPWATF